MELGPEDLSLILLSSPSRFLGNIKEAFDKNPSLKNLLLDDFFKTAILNCQVHIQPLKSGHLTNQDTFFCPKGVLIREVPLCVYWNVTFYDFYVRSLICSHRMGGVRWWHRPCC